MSKSKILKRWAKKHGIRVKNLKLKKCKPSDFQGLPFWSRKQPHK